ncbi:MAG TPA: hypothetical protein VGL11_24195 [Candidatus Binatia bacterium]|jgi:hypothetical protein
MDENKSWKILQIIPAEPGWTAVRCQESKHYTTVQIYNRTIVCWALVEAVGADGPQVRGIEQGSKDLAVVEDLIRSEAVDGDDREENQYFLGYNDPGAHKESDYWIIQAHERLRKEKETKGEERTSSPITTQFPSSAPAILALQRKRTAS